MKLREYFLSVKKQLEEYNDYLQNQLEDSEKKLSAEKLKAIHAKIESNRKLLEVATKIS